MNSKADYPDRINWNLAGIVLFFSYLVFSFSRLNLFPVFLDIYYHIGVMQGFDLAQGIVTWDFWEFAPIGRPHFYPPLLHIIMLILYKLGISKVNIAIFSSFIIFPAFIFTFWYVVKKIFGSRLAFFVMLSLVSSYSIFLGLTNTIAGTFCLMLVLLLFYTLHKDKKISPVILTALLFYTHYAVSIMGVLTLGLYFLFEKEKKVKLFLIIAGIIMALPWVINFASNIGYLNRVVHYEKGVEINLLLLVFSIIGFFLCLRLKGSYLFFIFLLLTGFIGTLKFPYRFFSTQPAAALIFLSGVAIERLFSWFSAKKLMRLGVSLISFIFFFNVFSASIVLNKGENVKLTQDSLFWNLAIFSGQNPETHNFRDVSLYRSSQDEFGEIVSFINSSSEKGDIIYSNYSYEVGMFAAFTERANATMSPYNIPVSTSNAQKHINNAKLILWLKNVEGIMEPELSSLINNMHLEKIAETRMFYLYRNPGSTPKIKISRAILSTEISFLLVFVLFGLIGWDLLRKE